MQIVLFWHKQLLSETKPDIAGKVRSHGVAIGMSKFVPPTPVELETLLKEFFDWYKKSRKELHPVELAALVHLKFVTIHPFSDGNGRLSRLMMNFVLSKHGFPMLDIPYTKRSSYYNALERSQVKKEEGIFTRWFFRRYEKENRKYLL
ncbi:MAG: Fic family protein [archaeon]